MKQFLLVGAAALLLAGLVSETLAQPQPTDKRPPGLNKPVGGPNRPGPGNGPGPNPGRPTPPRPKPPGPVRPPPPKPGPGRPTPPRPGPVRPVHPRPHPVRPAPNRPGFGFRPHKRYALGAYRRPPGYYFRQWDVGVTLPGFFLAQSYWLTAGTYGLSPPPPGTQWIRVDYDALLVTIATGRVIQVVPNIFY